MTVLFLVYLFPERRWKVNSNVSSPILIFQLKAGLLTFHPNNLIVNLARMYVYMILGDGHVTEETQAPVD